MTTPLLALVFFAAWAIALVCAVGGWRAAEVLSGKTRANGFASGQQHGSPLYWRLNRAHMNTVENLPIFAAIVLAGHLAGHTDGSFATCAVVVAGARVGQTLAHVSSGRSIAVHVRFTFFLAQLVAMGVMIAQLVSGA